MTLTEFLLAQIAKDEAAARAVGWTPRWVMAHDLPDAPPGIVAHIARHDPARVLAECAAKRRIVEALGDYDDGFVWASAQGSRAEDALLALASVYADHPDFDPAWKS